MGRPALAIRSAVAGAAAVALLSGCSGSGTTSASGSSTSSSSSSSSSSAAMTTSSSSSSSSASTANAAFCTQAQQLLSQVQSLGGTALTDPQGAAQMLQQSTSQLSSVQPPPEIASDWNSFVSTLQQLGQQLANVKPGDPNSAAALQSAIPQATAQLTASGQKIQSYVESNCSATGSSSAMSSSSSATSTG